MQNAATRSLLIAVPVLLCLLAFAGAGAGGSRALTDQSGTLWVVNRARGEVAVYDAASGRNVAVVGVGSTPNSVVAVPSRQKAYVTNEGSNNLGVVSTMTYAVVKTIPLGLRPHHIRLSPDQTRIYVSEYGTNKVAVLDTSSDALLAEHATHASTAARNHSTWITRDQRTLYTVNEIANEITALDPATGAQQWAVAVGNRPSEVIATRDGKQVYVSVRGGENFVKAIDPATHAVTGSLKLAAESDTLMLTPDEKLLLVAMRGQPAQLYLVDVPALTLRGVVDVAEAGTTAGHNWISANGKYSFVTYEGGIAPGVAVVDNATARVVERWPYPNGGTPHGIFYSDPAATDGPVATLALRTPRVLRDRKVRVAVGCAPATVGFCRGRVTLLHAASGVLSLAPGATGGATVRLSPVRYRQLARAGRLQATVVFTGRDQLDNQRVTTRRVTLRAR
jgi:YVTN family beta-propeller protein